MSRRVDRRSLLATAGAGLAAALAGCGYQPAGGELAWTRDFGTAGHFHLSNESEAWRSDGTYLYRVRNRDGRTFTIDGWVDVDDASVTAYDAGGDAAWSGTTERQYTGTLAVANGRVVLELEDGRLAALSADTASTEGDDGDNPHAGGTHGESHADDDPTAWTARTGGDGSLSELYASDDVVVCVHADGLDCFDAGTGDERFGRSLDSLGVEAVRDVAVAADRTWVAGDGTLVVLDGSGTVDVRRSIPESPGWLVATPAGAVVPAEDELWILDREGERASTVAAGGTRSSPIVADRTRCYYEDGTTLFAIDVDAGRVAWRLDGYSFRDGPVVDADGVYGRGTAPEADRCGLFAITPAGEHWWHVPTLEEVNCRGNLRLLDDRLVVRDGDRLYGFRTEPGRRFTLL